MTRTNHTEVEYLTVAILLAIFEFLEGTGQPENPKNETVSGEDARTSEINSQRGGRKNPTNAERTPEPQNFKQTAINSQRPETQEL